MKKSSETGKRQLPMSAASLLPHKPPMQLIDSLDRREGEMAEASALLIKDGLCMDGDHILPEYYIELIAQTAAAASGYDALAAGGGIMEGMLVGIDDFKIQAVAVPGSPVSIHTERQFHFGPVSVIRGKILSGKKLIAEGVIKVWEKPEDGDEG